MGYLFSTSLVESDTIIANNTVIQEDTMEIPASRHPTLITITLSALFFTALLTACGGGDGGSRLENGNGNGDGNGNGAANGNGVDNGGADDNLDSAPRGSLGTSVSGTFDEGTIGLSTETTPMLPAGRASLSVALYSLEGGLIDSSADLTFSSSCLSSGDAMLVDGNGETIENNTLPLERGRAEVVYVATGCARNDSIRAITSYENSTIDTAATTVEIAPPRFGSGDGDAFALGTIGVEREGETLLPEESTSIKVSLVDPDDRLAEGAAEVIFQSGCLDEALATLTDGEGSTISGPVETESGHIELTYTANGCLNEDRLTATASYEGIASGEATAVIDHVPARFGKGIEEDFTPGEIQVGVSDASLSAGGRTSLEVTLVDQEGGLIPVPATISFNSYCLARGEALLARSGEDPQTSFETENGVLEVTYTAYGCDGTDNITATATVGENEIGKAYASIEVDSDAAQNIVFTSAEPELISTKGAGGKESSTLTFQVLGITGAPLRNVPVNFALSNELGGAFLSHDSATSDASGYVTTTVNAGVVPNTVRVTASTADVVTESNRLTISTGIPDQNSFSLSVENHYPVAAWNVDGVEVPVTIRLADAFNNPPPDGTAVYFTTSGGAIESTCLSENGACTVTWRSQSPRPGMGTPRSFEVTEQTDAEGDVTSFNIEPCPNGLSECRHGRVRVLATALGNESFIDETGSGLYDGPSVDIFATGGDCAPNRPVSSAEVVYQDIADIDALACDDLGEAYLDKNFNGQRDPGEEFVDENIDATYSPGDGIYNGILCSEAAEAAGDCTKDTVTIRDHQTIVMTCDTPYYMPNRGRLPGQRDVELANEQTTTVSMLLADCNGNGMPEGTEVSLDLSGVNNVAARVSPENPLGASGEPTVISVTLEADDTQPASGTVEVIISSPSGDGIKESKEYISITAN